MFSLLLGLAILIMNKQALGGVFMLNQDTWGKEEQCKELIIQHLLTFGKSQFDPELVKNCITFLRSEQHENYPIVAERSVNEHMEIITTQPDSEKTLTTLDKKFDKYEITDKNIQDDFQGTSKIKELAEKFKDPSSSEDLKSTPTEDDDIIEMYPENIIQEWPAVEMVRKRRTSGKEEETIKSTIKDNTDARELHTLVDGLGKHIQKDTQTTSESEELSEKPKYPYLGKDYKPPPPKDDLVDIYPEKPLPEWPAVEMIRQKRSTGDQESTNNEDTEAYVSPGRPSWERHTPQDDMELDQRSRPGTYQKTTKATRVKATTKKVTDPVVSSGPPSWEKHTLADDLNLDERSRNRPQTKIQWLIFYFNRFINYFKIMFGLGPKVIKV